MTFYFAWANKNEAFDPLTHAVEDENIFSFEVSQSEGDFAILTIVVKNPRIGLLAPSRRVWGWLSWHNGTDLIPLFYGRLVGVPTDINKEMVTLVFNARPADFVALKAAKADTLKELPYYDPIWIAVDSLDDPDTVLEARSALWSIDRVTHEVDVSDVLVGEDGTEEFTTDDIFYDSVAITLGETPLRSVEVDATVNWTQSATGTISYAIDVETYTGQSLINDWPDAGTDLGGGWSVESSYAIDDNKVEKVETPNYSYNWQNTELTHTYGDTMSISLSSSLPLMVGPYLFTYLTQKWQVGVVEQGTSTKDPVNRPAVNDYTQLIIPLWHVRAGMTLKYEASRKRKEHARFTLEADVQDLITLAEDADVLTLALNSQDVGAEVDGGLAPLTDVSRRSYLPTDRGLSSLEYLIALARANLLIRSRCVEIAFDCTFARAIALSCRKNARVDDDRLPGGMGVGKIIKYKFGVDGATGVASGSATIGCAIGYGGSIVEEPGDPVYAAPGYMAPGYQRYVNRTTVLPGGDVSYVVPADAVNDDGLIFPLTKARATVKEAIHGDKATQADLITESYEADIEVDAANPQTAEEFDELAALQTKTTTAVLKDNPVWYQLELRPVTGASFETAYDIETSVLKVPKMIDLEAAAS